MRKIRYVVLISVASVAMALLGCAKNGDDGKAFGVIDGATSDVTALDLTGVGAQPDCCTSTGSRYYAYGKSYQLTPGTGTIYWVSRGTTYFLVVDVSVDSGSKATNLGLTKGKDGSDKTYHTYFSGNTLFVSSEPVPALSSSGPTDSRTQIESAEGATGLAQEGLLKKLD